MRKIVGILFLFLSVNISANAIPLISSSSQFIVRNSDIVFNEVAASPHLYVAVKGGQETQDEIWWPSSNRIFTSPDGITWTIQTPVPAKITGIAYGSGTFAISCDNGGIYSSKDGIQWFPSKSREFHSYNTNMNYDKEFITMDAGGDGGGGYVMKSGDGWQWESAWGVGVAGQGEQYLSAIIHAQNKYVAIGFNGLILTSIDGQKWELQKSGLEKPNVQENDATHLKYIKYLNNKFIAINSDGRVVSSPDGKTWTILDNKISDKIIKAGFNVNEFIVVDENKIVYHSNDGINWEKKQQGIGNSILNNVKYIGNKFIITGEKGIVLTSDDGKTWIKCETSTQENLYDVIYADNQYIVIGDAGTVLISPDGIKWEQSGLGEKITIKSIGHGKGKVMAVGEKGSIYSYYKDGWKKEKSPTNNSLYYLGYINNEFIAVGENGTIISSSDGKTWNVNLSDRANTYLYNIIYKDGKYIAIGSSGMILISKDKAKWLQPNSNTNDTLDAVIEIGNKIYTVGNSAIFSSSNGIKWEQEKILGGILTGIAASENNVVIIQQDGVILSL